MANKKIKLEAEEIILKRILLFPKTVERMIVFAIRKYDSGEKALAFSALGALRSATTDQMRDISKDDKLLELTNKAIDESNEELKDHMEWNEKVKNDVMKSWFPEIFKQSGTDSAFR